ncbi:hypothetical protein PI124_g19837 [Phytophthora idaei]|nr:hypothetical protein PI124_g19837 [Phytophthora idaei]
MYTETDEYPVHTKTDGDAALAMTDGDNVDTEPNVPPAGEQASTDSLQIQFYRILGIPGQHSSRMSAHITWS